MTREEAIALLNEQYETCKRIYDCSADQRKSYPNVPQFMEALDMALSAIRPVSREQVEKVWRGCDLCLDDSWQRNLMIPKRFDHTSMLSAELAQFCPGCGRPLTDEAVETIMKRMEEMRND